MHRSKFQILLSLLLLFNIAEYVWYQQTKVEEDFIEVLQEEISENTEQTSENQNTDKLDSSDSDGILISQYAHPFFKGFFLNLSIVQQVNKPVPKLYILYGQLRICIV
jgi:hypothetical protein